MPPSKEPNLSIDYVVDGHSVPSRFVTMAVNYELSMIDSFFNSQRKRRPESLVDESLRSSTSAALTNVENDAPNIRPNDDDEGPMTTLSSDNESSNRDQIDTQDRQVTIQSPTQESMRRSAREKKRETTLNKSRVRYDMQLVPPARRHGVFLGCFPLWWLPRAGGEKIGTTRPPRRRSSRLEGENHLSCDRCEGPALQPFAEDTSVLWVPKNRGEWEDTISELTVVCTSAAIRRYNAEKSPEHPFHPPLSQDYIRDRVDIDDPLHGYQLRHKTGGWLQGYIMWTNFTTWTHNFHWDSKQEICGMEPTEPYCDVDGSLSQELESLERAGDPHGGGIVFPSVAEIALVGGLGCGEYMLRLAMEDIRAAKKYKYVVLQSTMQSKAFYERFGFIRVGAICQYGLPKDDGTEHPVVGYRHWTHANESEKSLQMHGGPSYMMCLKLPPDQDDDDEICSKCGRPVSESNNPNFKAALMSLQVHAKPTIEQLGGSFSPAPRRRANTLTGSISGDSFGGNSAKKARRVLAKSGKPSSVVLSNTGKRRHVSVPDPSKRRRLNGYGESFDLFATASYNQSGQGRQTALFACAPGNGAQDNESRYGRRAGRSQTSMQNPGYQSIYDGRFIASKASASFDSSIQSKSSARDNENRNLGFGRPDGKPTKINRNGLMKQKVKSYPRSRVHFFNRVVKPIAGPKKYYFVLHNDETLGKLRLAPMEARGFLTGKREGRHRFQVILEDTDANFLTVNADDYAVVPACMVMKTPLIANEAWDIEET